MNKSKRGRSLSLKTDQRRALLRILAVNLVLKGKIKTTRARAKELSPFVEKAITIAKKPGLNSVRSLSRFLPEKAVSKLVKEIAPRYLTRHGGYLRVIKIEPRHLDNAQMAVVEFVK